jgi:hypothetical protein
MSQNIYAVLFFSSVFYRWHTFRRIEAKNNFSSASLLTLNNHNNRIILELDLGLDDKQKKEIDVVVDINNTEKNKNPSLHFSQQDVEFEKAVKTPVNRSAAQEQLEPQESTTIKLTYLEKFVWILINIVHVLPYCVVLGYWCFVYKYSKFVFNFKIM